MIRRADLSDVDHIARLSGLFHAYSPWREVSFSPEAAERVARSVVEHGVMFVTEDGMCGGVLTPLFFSPETLIAAELCWWAPTQGRELRQAFEGWARDQGAYAVQFSALGDDRAAATARLYRTAGFTPAETVYLKRL